MTYTLSSPPPYEKLNEPASSSLLTSFKQSLSSLTVSPSKIDVEVLPFDSVDMYGQPDRDSAYSLSGQIAVTLTPPVGLFGEAPAADESFLLESLVVTFEGQSELVTPQTGYSSCRLIEFSRELLSEGPLEIRHSWSQGASRDPARWFIVFNITIPGWLPASSKTAFHDSALSEPEITYRLSAAAKYRENKPTAKLSWRSACYGYVGLPTSQAAHANGTSVKINRYILPPPQCVLAGSELTETMFRNVEYTGTIQDTASQIPYDVLSKLRMQATIPEHIPVDSGSIPLLIKIRPEGLSAEERQRLRLPGFAVSATQTDMTRSSMSKTFAAMWPVPPSSSQPPELPLQSLRSDSREYECGLAFNPSPSTCATSTHSLLAPDFCGRFEFDAADAAKAHFADARFERDDVYVRLRVDIPLRTLLSDTRPSEPEREMPVLRPTERGPLRSVFHALDISLSCAYDRPDGETAREDLKLTIPLSFVRVPPGVLRSMGTLVPSPTTTDVGADAPVTPVSSSAAYSYPETLPAYNVLYYRNGAPKEDPTPLPRYTPKGQLPEADPEPIVRDYEATRPAENVCKQTYVPAAPQMAGSIIPVAAS